jgi:transposase
MVTDKQVRRLFKLKNREKSISTAAMKCGMCENTARKYIKANKLPSQMRVEHTWRTRPDPFEDDWDEIKEMFETNSGLEAKTIFDFLQKENPGKYQDGQLRTLQRRIKQWKALEGPAKEVFFAQNHEPGKLGQSDFTRTGKLGITIKGERFDHMIYHFVLTYSNWEDGTICYSESFESLSAGLQNALWRLGGTPESHQNDKLTAAVQKLDGRDEFTRHYDSLMKHYNMKGRYSNTSKANEHGDVEQRHYRFKRAIDQALMLRGSRDFESLEEYSEFLRKLLNQLNAGRSERLQEELKVLQPLPQNRIDDCKKLRVKVGQCSTINVIHNVYSVHSRLIGEWVESRVYADHLEIWYAQRKVDHFPRLRGSGKHKINYRHIIDWLVRKPGAFENYRYREDLFPSTQFRMAYDWLKRHLNGRGHKEYLKILYFASKNTEIGVENALRYLMNQGKPIRLESIEKIVQTKQKIPSITTVNIDKVDVSFYDVLLGRSDEHQD